VGRWLKRQEGAAAVAGMSVRSARRWQRGALPSQARAPRHWRTRKDPFAEVWQSEIVPLLESDKDGELQATTILEVLEAVQPGRFGPAHLRTLQRRMRDWRALYGPDKQVYFEQVHPPGREAAVDFTHATELGVTILGQVLWHLLFLFRLSFSKWMWVEVAFGETYEALVSGVQGAVWDLGGVPHVLRSDNLSAATHESHRTLKSGHRETPQMRPLRIAGRKYRGRRWPRQGSDRVVWEEGVRSAGGCCGNREAISKDVWTRAARPSAASGPSACTASRSLRIAGGGVAGSKTTRQDAPGSTIGTSSMSWDLPISR
jgi:hypothetical protein